jgi:hypothetical protein
VCSNHSDLENPGSLLRSDTPEKGAQEPSETGVDRGFAVASGPDDVLVHAIDHDLNLIAFRICDITIPAPPEALFTPRDVCPQQAVVGRRRPKSRE